ncbi:MAG: thioredoxin-disulfide reductase [Thermoplasmata archaeon]
MSENVTIIGSGPAGLTAAIYCGRDNFNPLLITGIEDGGQLELTTNVENFPAFPEGILGPNLMERMHKHAEKFGTRFKNDYVTDIELDTYPYRIHTSQETIESRSVIIATGSSARWLGIPSEKKFIGRGVSSCATCDAPFFKEKDVVVVGGGDTAMEDSLYLTSFARSVTIVHRRDRFRASSIMQERVLSNPKVSVIWNSEVTEIRGDKVVKSLVIRTDGKKEATEKQIDGVFVAIGHKPNTDFVKGKLPLNELGYIITRDEVMTDYDGVFVAGDVADPRYKQAITAAGSGCKAALRVRHYLQEYS